MRAKHTASEQKLRREIVAMGRRLYDRGLVAATDGNISARLGDNRVVATPSGVSKGALRTADLVVVDLTGRLYGDGQPTSELGLHLEAYRLWPDVSAAIHAHPPWAIAASLHPETRYDLVPEAIAALGPITRLDYARPGSPDVAAGLRGSPKGAATFLLARHGSLTLGVDLEAAFIRLEALEHNSQIALLAIGAGQLAPLPDSEIRALRAEQTQAPPPNPVRGQSRVRISDEELMVAALSSSGYERD